MLKTAESTRPQPQTQKHEDSNGSWQGEQDRQITTISCILTSLQAFFPLGAQLQARHKTGQVGQASQARQKARQARQTRHNKQGQALIQNARIQISTKRRLSAIQS